MKMGGIVLLLLSLGLSTGHKIKCYTCHARDAQYCKGEETECPEGSSCMTVSEKSGFNHTFYSIQKRCSLNLNCTGDLYAYVDDNTYYHLSYQCCNSDLCNNGSNKLYNISHENNGLECPTCALYDSLEKCTPVAKTVCRSATDQCSYLVGWLIKPDGELTKFSVQGCMSEASCKLDHSQVIGYRMQNITDKGCYIPKSK